MRRGMMHDPGRRSLLLGGLTLVAHALILALAAPAAAQRPVYAPASAPTAAQAWLGVGYEVRWIDAGEDCQPQVVVESVVQGAPAERAGLRAGDAIVALEGAPALPARLEALGHALAPGDSVRLRVARGGVVREMVAVADRRPQRPPALAAEAGARLRASKLPTIRVHGDTLIGREIEHLALAPGERYVVRHPDGRSEYRRSLWTGGGGDELDRRVARLIACARSKGWAAGPGPAPAPDRARILLRADSLRVAIGQRALERATEARTVAAELEAVASEAGRFTIRATPEGEVHFFRFEDHTAAAERGVAGAEVTPLEPELAAYFRGVRSGLLVLRVSDGTPAHRAGLRPGDVITAGAGTRIPDVATLRRLLSLPDARPLALDIVRHGRSRTLTIRRE